jgi:SAND domain
MCSIPSFAVQKQAVGGKAVEEAGAAETAATGAAKTDAAGTSSGISLDMLADAAASIGELPPMKVVCGTASGLFYPAHPFMVQIVTEQGEGKKISAAEFEILGGKGTYKKWKNSVRLLKTDGSIGEVIGAWLKKIPSYNASKGRGKQGE